MGRDFAAMGTEDGVKMRYGDGGGGPYPGPVVTRFIDRNTFIVIDSNNVCSVQSLSGKVSGILVPESQRPEEESGDEEEDEYAKFDKNKGKKERKVEERYLDIYPVDLCPIPHSSNIAICDKGREQLAVVNRRDFSPEQYFGKEGGGIEKMEFRGISGVDCFSLGQDTIYCVSEKDNHRVQIFTDDGHCLGALNKGCIPGRGKEQLYSPSSVACYLDPHRENGKLDDMYYPRWYLGEADINTLEMSLANEYQPGHFFVGKRPNQVEDAGFGTTYDMVYVTRFKRHVRVTIEKLTKGGVMKRESSTDPVTYQSTLDLVKRLPYLVKAPDVRPSCLIAVADQENQRVQVFRFYWTDSDIVEPSFQHLATIGGLRDQTCELKKPSKVAYSSTGEMLIVDEGLKAVLVFSQVMSIVRKIKLDFPPSYLIRQQMDGEAGKNLRLINKVPVSASFSLDGKIAVGYKSGGIMVHNAYRAFALGDLEKLTQQNFHLVLGYLQYPDAVNLRNTCWFLHNFTRKYRDSWSLYPMRKSWFHYSAYGFVKWSSLPGGGHKDFGELIDKEGKPVCLGYQEGTCTHQNSCPKRHTAVYLDPQSVEDVGACLDRKCFGIVLVRMFGSNFFWRYELYLDELMIAYGRRQRMEVRGDPMTRRNETVRERRYEEELTVGLKGYMEIMTTCEEVYSRQTVMHEHTLFSRQGKDRYRPMAEYNPEAIPLAWVDRLKQYTDRGIDVPWKVNRTRKFRVVGGMEEATRGMGCTSKSQHLQVHKKESDKVVTLMHNLFKSFDEREAEERERKRLQREQEEYRN